MRKEKALSDEASRIYHRLWPEGREDPDGSMTINDREFLGGAYYALAWALGWPWAKAPTADPAHKAQPWGPADTVALRRARAGG